MKHCPARNILVYTATSALLLALAVPGSAFFWGKKEQSSTANLPEREAVEENQPPIAKDMDLSTYKNVPLTGWFDAMDLEGESLTFQLTRPSARGSVQLSEDGSGQFVYSPYENKTGRDSFGYMVTDSAGHKSGEATVSIRITKPDTKVVYRDMDGNPAHKSAIRLAEKGIYIGARRNGGYYFQPDDSVSRGEFLSLAMAAADLDPLTGITATGFYDDTDIPKWCKGYVSSALMAGAIQGSTGDDGLPVFDADSTVTYGQAAVMLDRLLDISDVSVETFSPAAPDHWASQSAANLASVGVLEGAESRAQSMSAPLTRGEVAELLDGALDVMERRQNSRWFTL